MSQFAQREAMAHRKRPRADETLPAVAQSQSLDRPAGRVRTIEHPNRLPVPRRLLEYITQRRDEGVDAATDVLQIDQQNVERVHHGGVGSSCLPVEAEYRNAVHRIQEVR
jgi:hypothetical protein